MPRTTATPRLLPLTALTAALALAVSLVAAPAGGQAADPQRPGTLVVTYRSDGDAAPVESVAARVGDVEATTPQLDRVEVAADDVDDARRALASLPGVTSVVEDVPVRALNLGSWNLGSRAANGGGANAYAAQTVTTGVGVTVAVIDTGVDANPDLPSSRVLTGRNMITGTAGGGLKVFARSSVSWPLVTVTAVAALVPLKMLLPVLVSAPSPRSSS